MSLKTPLARVRGLGSAKNGSSHWWVQRLTALLLLVTLPWLVWLLLSTAGADFVTLRLTVAQPFNAMMMTLLVIGAFWHAQLGLQVVIEDYIHGGLEIALQILVKFACLAAGIASVIAIGRIAFGT
ncbi:MAG: succinate dehydrogenase, hydrophobic membrane anchor protein [Rhodanobacteraceae bacterium]|nr:succinate dehydrogenase, hydrophobic membrane anchor protein [Xanthomonadales bacterium]MCP5477986.1 succinate dehydrogenase, hydrophobic membrane anchor protein [Rhodanobacteraceae bacterium]HPF73178.1 succinate dehydrogenase, hydrophobic membrane anchor protein [Xanthomonadaceae bacterium]HRX98646.1 succinate dehydrogenase, hydrophobic membrane anchor protein [Xanthomonadaceae bacterium]